MVRHKYEVDDDTEITVSLGALGKKTIEVNGTQLTEKAKLKNKKPYNFKLRDGRDVSVLYRQVGFVPEIEIRVDEKLMLPTAKDNMKECSSCKTRNKPNDKFCGKCGAELPAAEFVISKQKVAGARGAIMALAVLFAIFGILMSFLQKSNVDQSMANLAQFQDSDIYPEYIAGQQYTVGELKQKIVTEMWTILALNLFLASIMLGLWFWAKNSPLPAIIVASAIYGVVIVGNAIYDPNTIAQGIIMKFIIISILFKGIKSALATRHAKAS